MPLNVRRRGDWYDVALMLVLASPILVVLILLVFAHLHGLSEVLNGRDVLDASEIAEKHLKLNYTRNSLELTSFFATTALLVTALWAFVFTKSQLREARDTRLATLYAALETRWSSAEMQKAKIVFSEITSAYETARAQTVAQGLPTPQLEDFADDYVRSLQRQQIVKYFQIMSLLEYLEYIGMLEIQGHIDIEGIDYILGSVCLQVHSVFVKHIDHLRQRTSAARQHNGLPNMPDDFYCLSELAGKFVNRYS